MNKSPKIIFFGTPEFAVPSLQALYQKEFDILLVVTQPDKPVGRKQILTPSPVKVEAKKLGLEVLDNLTDLPAKIKKLQPEIGVVVAYGKILPIEILNLFPKGVLNIHPSLLPKYRGPSPIEAAILNGDKETGVSIIKLDDKMDHGPLVAQITILLSQTENQETLSADLAKAGADLLVRSIPDYLSGQLQAAPQDDSLATFVKILKREDGKIDFNQPAEKIERQIRAYFPWPGSFSEQGKFKVIEAEVYDIESDKKPGQLFELGKKLYLQCTPGVLRVKKIQPEGKKPMSEAEYINGYLK